MITHKSNPRRPVRGYNTVGMVILMAGLVMFGLPALAGLWSLGRAVHTASLSWGASDWQPVDVQLLAYKSRPGGPDYDADDDNLLLPDGGNDIATGNSFSVAEMTVACPTVRYQYQWKAQNYQGARIHLIRECLDGKQWEQRLSAAWNGNRHMKAWLNPAQPQETVLDRDIPGRTLRSEFFAGLFWVLWGLGVPLSVWWFITRANRRDAVVGQPL